MTLLDNVLATARGELGKPYVYGAEGPNTFDCSGLIQFVFGQNGISLPRTAEAQRQATATVTNPVAGDLVFYGNPATHVGLYIGNGQMLAAPHSGDVVKIQKVYGTPSKYGRVSSLGNTTTAPLSNAINAGWNPVGGAIDSVLGSVRNVVVEAAFITLGIGLVGYGAYRTLSSKNKDGA
jgi:hypothetical protein